MENLSSSIRGVSIYKQQPNVNEPIMSRPMANIVELISDDSDSDSDEDDELVDAPPAPASALEMSPAQQDIAIDTLDVSQLNYSFRMLRKKSITKPLHGQFITIKAFLGKLDKSNPNHTFTLPQYRRAWEYAVQLQENEVAVNEIVETRPELDAAGIEAEFVTQMQRISRSIHLVSIKTKSDRAAERHTELSRGLRSAREQNDRKKAHRLERQLAVFESRHGLGPNPAYAPRRKRMRARTESQRERDIQSMTPMEFGEGPMAKKVKKAKGPKENMNMLPMPHNRLADRVYKSPTPEQDIENPLALQAWEARAAMTMVPSAIATQQDPKPTLISSSIYYDVLNNENTKPVEKPELQESRDEHEKYCG